MNQQSSAYAMSANTVVGNFDTELSHDVDVVTPVDLSFLDEELRASARFTNERQEVMWPRAMAERVVNSVADHGFVVLGLDLRSDGDGITPLGLWTEVPISAFRYDEGDALGEIEAARVDALKALGRPELAADVHAYGWVLVTWDCP